MSFHLLLSILAGCGVQHDATVDVVVPVSVQEAWSEDDPGELMLSVETEGQFGGTYVLGVLCEPTEGDRTAPWVLSGTGCAFEATVSAWVQPASSTSTCQGPAVTVVEDLPPDDAVSGVLFAGNTSCVSGDDHLVLTLE